MPRYLRAELLNPELRKTTSAGTSHVQVFAPGFVTLRTLFGESLDASKRDELARRYPRFYAMHLANEANSTISGDNAGEATQVWMVRDPRPIDEQIRTLMYWANSECPTTAVEAAALREIANELVKLGASLGTTSAPVTFVNNEGCLETMKCIGKLSGTPTPCDRDPTVGLLLERADAAEQEKHTPKPIEWTRFSDITCESNGKDRAMRMQSVAPVDTRPR